MMVQHIKSKLVSAGLVTIATVGVALGAAGAAQADTPGTTYDTLEQCQSVADQNNSQIGDADPYYCAANGTKWQLWMNS